MLTYLRRRRAARAAEAARQAATAAAWEAVFAADLADRRRVARLHAQEAFNKALGL